MDKGKSDGDGKSFFPFAQSDGSIFNTFFFYFLTLVLFHFILPLLVRSSTHFALRDASLLLEEKNISIYIYSHDTLVRRLL
jgi:hypothetical protein